MKKANLIGALFVATVALAFSISAARMTIVERGIPGPGFIPLAVGILTLILSLVLAGQSMRMAPDRAPFLKRGGGLKSILKITVSLVAYVGCIHLVGYPVATLLFLFALLRWVGEYGYRFSLAVSIGVAVVLYGIFQCALGMIFPAGIFAEIFAM